MSDEDNTDETPDDGMKWYWIAMAVFFLSMMFMNGPSGATPMTDAEINAAVATRVCGWRRADVFMMAGEPRAEGFPSDDSCAAVVPDYAGNIAAGFEAQDYLASKGVEYWKAYLKEMADMSILAGWSHADFLLTASARTRALAMLAAVDAVEKAVTRD